MASRLTAISSMATHRILVGLATRYQETTGQAVAFTSMGGVDAARRVRAAIDKAEAVKQAILSAPARSAIPPVRAAII